jgi:hypothetical protein
MENTGSKARDSHQPQEAATIGQLVANDALRLGSHRRIGVMLHSDWSEKHGVAVPCWLI